MSVKQLVRRLVQSALVVTWPGVVAAQSHARLDLGGFTEVGGEGERYARVLQLAGLVPVTPWSIQPFSPSQSRALRPTAAHPWSARFEPGADSASVHVLRTSARLIGNSTFPVQVGGGPTWAGRGLTAEVQGGIAASWRALSLQAAPLMFVAQNAAFPLAPNGYTDRRRFADARFPDNIDAPQRFGDRAFLRVAFGTSALSVDTHGVVAGLSAAPQRWGPEREYPILLGPNAGGFPNVFIGSSRPWNLWLFQGHGRLVYGELGESPYATPDTGDHRRLGTGLVLVATPRGVPGLEIGLGRFLHRPWRDLSVRALERPFSGIFSNGSGMNQAFENQMASAFARWVLPRARAEFYGEFYKEDYPGRFRQGTGSLIEMPDDLASFAFGFQHLLRADSARIRSIHAELVNGESSHQERLERGFTTPIPPYIHSREVQGHTLDGLLLGSPEAYGGAGWTIGIDDFTARGRRSLSLQRTLRLDWLPGVGTSVRVHPDEMYSLRAEALCFRGTGDIGIVVIPTLNLNRNLVAHHDVPNLTVALTMHGW